MCGCRNKISGVMKKSKVDFKEIGMRVVGISAGAIGAGFLAKVAPNMNPKIKSAAIIVAGAALPMLSPKTKLVEYVGDGMIAQGANMIMGSFFPSLVSGPGDMMEEETYTETVSGDGDGYGTSTENILSGVDISGADDDDDEHTVSY